MIHTFEIKDPEKTHIPWMSKVQTLAKPRKFEFTPGLNILWGRNGSGKSTLIKAIARLTHCEQGGRPCVTRESMGRLVSYAGTYVSSRRAQLLKAKAEGVIGAVALQHDGQGVRFFDPSNAVGLVGGGAAFDDDFFGEGVANVMFKGSAGEQTKFRFEVMAQAILQGEAPRVEWRIDKSAASWDERVKVAEFFLQGSGEEGPPTILLDEPERSYDLPTQMRIWRVIQTCSAKIQFIVASHSVFALQIPEAHYIEMENGYLDESLRCVSALHLHGSTK